MTKVLEFCLSLKRWIATRRERLCCASDTITLGTSNFSSFWAFTNVSRETLTFPRQKTGFFNFVLPQSLN